MKKKTSRRTLIKTAALLTTSLVATAAKAQIAPFAFIKDQSEDAKPLTVANHAIGVGPIGGKGPV